MIVFRGHRDDEDHGCIGDEDVNSEWTCAGEVKCTHELHNVFVI